MGGQLGFLYRQLAFHPKPVPDKICVDGRTALVTGAGTIGSLGHEAAKEMAAHGLSRLIIAARNVAKAEAVRQDIVKGNGGVHVEVWELDRLDIVVLSAGVKFLEYKRSETGHEAHVQVNHLGTALLSLALLEPLQRTEQRLGSPTKMYVNQTRLPRHLKI